MSDNPADSLRRELEAAFSAAYEEACKRPVRMGMTGPVTVAFAVIWPRIIAALEAARADERERAQRENQQLRAENERLRGLTRCICGPDRTGEAPADPRPDCPQHGVDAGTNRWPTEAPF